MIKALLPVLFVITVFFLYPAKANEIENGILVTDWTVGGEASTYILYEENNAIAYSKWAVSIATSIGGKTRVYIEVYGEFNECDKSLLPKVLEVDGRQVSMQPSCIEYINAETYYVSFTPVSEEGLQYVIDTFKSTPSDELVIIDGLGDTLGNIKPFSADGFTDAYELNRVL